MHGEKFGVIVAVQNHGDFINTGPEHLSLLKRVDHQWCAAMVDTGKYNTADPYTDIATMAPYAVNWQIKELIATPAIHPRTDMKKLHHHCPQVRLSRLPSHRDAVLGRKGYDSFVEVPKMLAELNEAIAATAPGKMNLTK